VSALEPAPRRCGVLGSPISHSLSPVLHRAAYDYLGLGWSYTAHDVREHELAGFIRTLDPSWRGLSLTMPLKRVALEVASRVSELADSVGAANTLLHEDDGSWSADNTDVPGMVAAIQRNCGSACVWGGGATAASAVAALARLGTVAERLGVTVEVLPWQVSDLCAAADVVVSTVPAGAADLLADPLAKAAAPHRLLFDVVYDPWPTPLAAAWEKCGGAVASGLDLLVHQAVGQLKLMTGQDVPPHVLYTAVR
jgi:shikimate dehydrogenase